LILSKDNSTYKEIAKSTWIFGSSQVVVLLVNVLKTKFIAIFLGTQGYGLISLFNSTINLIGSLTGFGLGTSAIKDIAEYKETNYEKSLETVSLVRKLVWYTGVLGMFFFIALSPFLSNFIFGNKDYTWAFVILSFSILINQLTIGNSVILTGLRKRKNLANANMSGAILGFVFSIPLYYLFGEKAIVPTILISSFVSFLRSKYFTREIDVPKNNLSFKESLVKGKPMLLMGLMLSLTSVFTFLKAFVLRIFIEKTGGIDQVGLFHSGFVLINVYLGMIFSVMSKDYFPNLASKIFDHKQTENLMNKQLIFGLTIISPLLCLFIVFNNYLIVLLFSVKFKLMHLMIAWAVLGTIFKLVSWTQSYYILTKGNNKRFVLNELSAVIFTTILSIIFYYYYSLTGLGIAYFLGYIYYALQTNLLSKYWYGFQFSINSFFFILLNSLIVGLCFYSSIIIKVNFLGFLLLFISICISYFKMKKMGFTSKLNSIFKKA